MDVTKVIKWIRPKNWKNGSGLKGKILKYGTQTLMPLRISMQDFALKFSETDNDV
jgi:hypothetical protein